MQRDGLSESEALAELFPVGLERSELYFRFLSIVERVSERFWVRSYDDAFFFGRTYTLKPVNAFQRHSSYELSVCIILIENKVSSAEICTRSSSTYDYSEGKERSDSSNPVQETPAKAVAPDL